MDRIKTNEKSYTQWMCEGEIQREKKREEAFRRLYVNNNILSNDVF